MYRFLRSHFSSTTSRRTNATFTFHLSPPTGSNPPWGAAPLHSPPPLSTIRLHYTPIHPPPPQHASTSSPRLLWLQRYATASNHAACGAAFNVFFGLPSGPSSVLAALPPLLPPPTRLRFHGPPNNCFTAASVSVACCCCRELRR